MILRRFAQHIKEQNWFAVGLDVVVVIVGVYLGIVVGDLANEKNTRKEIVEAVHMLDAQLLTDLNNLNEIVAYRTKKLSEPIAGIQELEKTEPDLNVVSNALYLSYRRNYTFFPNSSGYRNLVDRGFLPKLNDIQLKQALSDLFDRVYVRHVVVADESDRIAFDYSLHFAEIYWDFYRHKFVGDPTVASARLRNALLKTHANSEWYVQYLSETGRPAIENALQAVKRYLQNSGKQDENIK